MQVLLILGPPLSDYPAQLPLMSTSHEEDAIEDLGGS